MDPERRYIQFNEMRVIRKDENELPTIEGYAVIFNSLSADLGGFKEKVEPGAFKNAMVKSDVRALFNHDPNIIIGRTGKNLTVKEDNVGLFMRVEPVDTPNYRSVAADIVAGLVTQQSFGFTVKTDRWDENKETGEVTRTLLEIDELFDVSPVTYPAYNKTGVTVAQRKYEKFKEKKDAATGAQEGATALKRKKLELLSKNY